MSSRDSSILTLGMAGGFICLFVAALFQGMVAFETEPMGLASLAATVGGLTLGASLIVSGVSQATSESTVKAASILAGAILLHLAFS